MLFDFGAQQTHPVNVVLTLTNDKWPSLSHVSSGLTLAISVSLSKAGEQARNLTIDPKF